MSLRLEIIMKSHQSDFRNILHTKRSDEVNIIWSDIYSKASPLISPTLYALFSQAVSVLFLLTPTFYNLQRIENRLLLRFCIYLMCLYMCCALILFSLYLSLSLPRLWIWNVSLKMIFMCRRKTIQNTSQNTKTTRCSVKDRDKEVNSISRMQ